MKAFITIFLLACSAAYSQYINPLELPPATPQMPAWANYLYATPLNFHALDSSYTAFYAAHPFEKNNYTKYYRRLHRRSDPFIRQDGTLEVLNAPQMEEKFSAWNKQNTALTPQASATKANWRNFTMDTRWKVEDLATQAQCPWQVNIYGFDISRSNPNILVAGSETAGIYRTVDKGVTWKQIGKGYVLGTEAISIHPTDPNTIIIGTNGAIRRTTDAGQTWTTVFTSNDLWCNDIEIHPANPSIVFAAANSGLYRSADGGLTWKQITAKSVCELEVHPTNASIVYILRRDDTDKFYEFYKSTDGGLTFSLKSNGWKNIENSGGRMTVTPAGANVIYAVVLTAAEGPKVMKSTDAGESWTLAAQGSYTNFDAPALKMTNGQGYYDLSIVASQENAQHFIVATTTAYRSTDGGATFTNVGGYSGPFPIHPDIQEMKAIGKDTWIATDGGMTLSNDFFADTKNAVSRTTGLNGSDFWGFDSGWNEDVLVGGRYHNGNTAYSEKYGNVFLRLGGGEAATGYVNPMRPRKTFHSDIGGYIIPDSSGGRSSSFGVGLWPNESYYPMEFSEMAWDARYYSTVYIGRGNGIYRSDNDGASYDTLFISPDAKGVMEHIEQSRSNPDIIYCSQRSNSPAEGKIWRTSDGGKSWNTIPMPMELTAGQRRVMAITLSGTNPNVLWAAFRSAPNGKIVFRTNDGGKTWENLTTPAIASLTPSDIVHQLGTNGGVYLACEGGNIYYRNSAMSDWAYFGDGLPVSHFTRALKPFYRDGKLRAGSNQGIWETGFYEPSVPLAQPTVDKRRTTCIRDTFYFDDYSALERSNATWKWDFPGASFVSSPSVRNPLVVYHTPGNYAVTLTVSNTNGNNTKTISNMVEVLPSECGMDSTAGMAMNLSSKTDALRIEKMPALAGATTFSVAAWLKLDTIQASFSQIVSNWSSNVGFSFGFSFQGYRPNTNMTFYWNGVPYQLTSAFNLPVGEWLHAAMTVEPDKVTLYFNGKPWEYKGDFTNFDLSSTPFEIGGGLPGQGGNFRGQIEELRFYRRALTIDEVRQSMHLIPTDTAMGLVALYQFNELSPERLYDRTGSAHSTNSGGTQVVSTAPVAVGTSDVTTLSGATTHFPNTAATLSIGDNNGRTVGLYRLNSKPDSTPSGLRQTADEYWILRSWGASTPISTDSMTFGAIAVLGDKQYLPASFTLYKRENTLHDNIWKKGLAALSCDYPAKAVKFAGDASAEGQYIIGFTPLTGVVEQADTTMALDIIHEQGTWRILVRGALQPEERVIGYDIRGRRLGEIPLTPSLQGYTGVIPQEFIRTSGVILVVGNRSMFFSGR